MKRTSLKRGTKQLRRTSLRARHPAIGHKIASKGVKSKKAPSTKKGQYVAPKWFKSIKPGSHGKTTHQKRLWRVISETYREQDWNNYGPHCPCCGIYLNSWKDGQLGHWLRYSLCNGWMKYERANLALICSGCNVSDDAITLHKLGETLRIRYGDDILQWIEEENERPENRGVKQELWMCVDYAARIAPHLLK